MNAREECLTPINGYEGIYSVTMSGRVWAHERIVNSPLPNGVSRRSRVGGRWLSHHKSSSYLQVVFQVNNRRSMPQVHRLIAEAFIPNPKRLPEVNHIDGDKLNNAIENLEWVTRSENQKHAWKTGLQKNTPARISHGRALHEAFAPWRNA